MQGSLHLKLCVHPFVHVSPLSFLGCFITYSVFCLFAVLVALYEETDKPNNALDFIKLHLGAAGPEPADTETLRMELADLQQKYSLLMEENKELRNRLMQYEPSPEEGAQE
uniref:MYC binding protein n=1 Tax=Monopterus albus TaxID=43700 RepID=A0A3Q3K8B3_MONAL